MASVRRCSPPPTLAPPSGDEPVRFHLLDSSSPSFGARGPSRCGGGGRSSDAAAAASRLLNGGDGGGSRGSLLREQPVPSLDPQGEASPGGEGQHMEAYAEQEAKKMATVLDGVSSCGSITTPFPCVSRVLPETSPARSDADTDPEKEPEAMGGRGAPYGRHPASSYSCCAAWSAASLTAHRAACPSPICRPVSSKGNDGYRDGGERRDDGHMSSFVTSQQEQELATDAVNGWRLPKVSEEEDEAVDQKDWQDDTLSSRVSSARGWNFESNSAYEGSNHDDGCAFDHSEVEDCAAAVQRMERRLRGPAMKQKDAQIEKLIDKLNQKEAQIDQWPKNKIAHARDKMTKSRSWRRRELKP